MEMYLDGRIIFQGEIARASGGVGGAEGSEVSRQSMCMEFTVDQEYFMLKLFLLGCD